jgi:Fe2+ transport system protein FeoA
MSDIIAERAVLRTKLRESEAREAKLLKLLADMGMVPGAQVHVTMPPVRKDAQP